MNTKKTIDLIMLSRFHKNDGGRETWADNFIPELLKDRNIVMNVFGFRKKEDEDNSGYLESLDSEGTKKVIPHLLIFKKYFFPSFISMFFSIRSYLKSDNTTKPDCTVAMGIFEAIIMLMNPRFKDSLKVIWMRSIFTHEKAESIPNFLIGLSKKFECFIFRRMDVILANGEDTKEYYEQFGFEVEAIKNSVESKKWNMPVAELNDVLKISYIGRLTKQKGIEDFIVVAKEMKASPIGKNFEFHVVGEANHYLPEIQLLDKENVIKFYGLMDNDELPGYMKDIHVCVALTYDSVSLGGGGLSNSLLEQMAAAKIILAWDTKIFQQIINEENGYLVEQYSVSDMVKTLEDIFKNKKKAIKKAIKARETIVPHTVESRVNQFLQMLSRNLEK